MRWIKNMYPIQCRSLRFAVLLSDAEKRFERRPAQLLAAALVLFGEMLRPRLRHQLDVGCTENLRAHTSTNQPFCRKNSFRVILKNMCMVALIALN